MQHMLDLKIDKCTYTTLCTDIYTGSQALKVQLLTVLMVGIAGRLNEAGVQGC